MLGTGPSAGKLSNANDAEEFSTPPTTPKSNGSPVAQPKLNFLSSQSKEIVENTQNSSIFSSELDEYGLGPPPSAPPRRRDRRQSAVGENSKLNSFQNHFTPPKPLSNGLPPTPKVHMGACFSKIFNSCPLNINCCASWIHSDTRDEHLLLGCDEGIYTLNMNELHDACLDQLFPRKTVWMFVIGNTLMSISGKTTHLYSHDILHLHHRLHSHKLSQTVDQVFNKIPEKFVPWKIGATNKISDTRGVSRVCFGHNKYNGYKYLCGATPNGLFLMQWYNPMNKFMLLKVGFVRSN